MYLRAELAALEVDDAPQRRAQDRTYREFAAWRAQAESAAWGEALARFGAGADLAQCHALAALFGSDPDPAAALVAGVTAAGVAALTAEPLSHIPLRHGGDAARATLLLGQSGDAALSLVARGGPALAAAPAPTSATFAPARHWLRVIAGSARVTRLTFGADGAIEPRPLTLGRVTLIPGDVLARDALSEALHFSGISGTLVTLDLNRRDRRADVAREVALADGAPLRQSACDPRDSRHELMAALLGQMARSDAAPALAALARTDAPAPLRWQVLREALALDTRAGFAALSAVANRPGDPLARAAHDLRAQLQAAHPQLRELAVCPA